MIDQRLVRIAFKMTNNVNQDQTAQRAVWSLVNTLCSCRCVQTFRITAIRLQFHRQKTAKCSLFAIGFSGWPTRVNNFNKRTHCYIQSIIQCGNYRVLVLYELMDNHQNHIYWFKNDRTAVYLISIPNSRCFLSQYSFTFVIQDFKRLCFFNDLFFCIQDIIALGDKCK